MKIKKGNNLIAVSFQCDKQQGAMALKSKIFKNWLAKTSPQFGIKSIEVTLVDFHSKPSIKNILFIRLRVKTITSPRNQIVELRGGTVAMLVNLICEERNTTYTVLVQQARIATGNIEFVEVPAGMVDHDSFVGAAAREIKEELGLVFQGSDLKKISEGLYLSPGLLDESCTFFLAERKVTPAELKKLQGKTYGVIGEGEHTTLFIVPLEDVPKITQDAKTILAWSLYHIHKTKK